jgi:hypothetical protein
MTMKTSLTAALAAGALLFTAAQALAASPHDGAWTLDPARSFWSNTGKLPTNFKLTVNFSFGDNKLTYHSANTSNPDKPYISDHVTTLDGTPTVFANQERFNQVSVTQTDPDDLQILKMKDGDVIAGEFWSFSADGKTAVRRGVGKSPEGKSHAYQEFFVHQ